MITAVRKWHQGTFGPPYSDISTHVELVLWKTTKIKLSEVVLKKWKKHTNRCEFLALKKNWRRAWRCFLSGKRLENDFILLIEKKKKRVWPYIYHDKTGREKDPRTFLKWRICEWKLTEKNTTSKVIFYIPTNSISALLYFQPPTERNTTHALVDPFVYSAQISDL